MTRCVRPACDGMRSSWPHGGDDRHIPFNRQRLENSGFEYVALGHIHKPQVLKKDRVIYAGALEPVDRNDTGRHGFIKGEVTEQGPAHKLGFLRVKGVCPSDCGNRGGRYDRKCQEQDQGTG